MRDMDDELIPSERDEEIYAAWESGKTPRVCAREFGVSRMEVERAIDRCLPVFNSKTELMAYKRERQRLDDIGSKYHAQAMAGDIDSGHLYARICVVELKTARQRSMAIPISVTEVSN